MCLVIKKDAVALIAEEDIPCVKILRIHTSIDGKRRQYMTPYQYCVVKPNQVVKAVIVRREVKSTDGDTASVFAVVNEGIHSFKVDATQAIEKELRWFTYIAHYHVIAVECIIPKGAEYYIGSFDDYGDVCYASTRLIYPKRFPRK